NALKIQRRRRVREQEAYMQSTFERGDDASSPAADDIVWRRVAPLLDDAMEKLSERDRVALMLRYFENRPWREVAWSLKVTEDAAQKRVARALEKLRVLFTKRGVTVTDTLIASAVSANSRQAVSAEMLKEVCVAAATNGTATPYSTLSIV